MQGRDGRNSFLASIATGGGHIYNQQFNNEVQVYAKGNYWGDVNGDIYAPIVEGAQLVPAPLTSNPLQHDPCGGGHFDDSEHDD